MYEVIRIPKGTRLVFIASPSRLENKSMGNLFAMYSIPSPMAPYLFTTILRSRARSFRKVGSVFIIRMIY